MTARLEGPRPPRPPDRTILESTTPRRRGRKGLIAVSTLECGHITDTQARDRKRGTVPCWDCFYLKPVSAMGAVIVAEHEPADNPR